MKVYCLANNGKPIASFEPLIIDKVCPIYLILLSLSKFILSGHLLSQIKYGYLHSMRCVSS